MKTGRYQVTQLLFQLLRIHLIAAIARFVTLLLARYSLQCLVRRQSMPLRIRGGSRRTAQTEPCCSLLLGHFCFCFSSSSSAAQKDIMDELLAVLGPVGTQLMLNDAICNNSGGAAAVQPLPLRSTAKMGTVSNWHNAEADAHQRSSMLGVLDSYLRQQHVAIVGNTDSSSSSSSSSGSSSSSSSGSKGKKGKGKDSNSSDSKRSTAVAAVLSILSQSMEDNLYRAARDAAEYSDIATLRTRVQWLAQQFCAVLQLSDVATDDSKQGKRKRSTDAADDNADDDTKVGESTAAALYPFNAVIGERCFLLIAAPQQIAAIQQICLHSICHCVTRQYSLQSSLSTSMSEYFYEIIFLRGLL
jgi:hypothetical protein